MDDDIRYNVKWQKRVDNQKGGFTIKKKKNTTTEFNKILEKTLV